ncbi:MAG: hypothetical protein AB7O24_07755 [Kofleriaceae bacterium]
MRRRGKSAASQRLLVVDGHGPSRIVMCLALRTRGYACVQTASESEAMDSIAAFRPTVILVDDSLGPDVPRRLRDHAKRFAANVQLVSISVEDSPTAVDADLCLTKPVDVPALDRWLRRSRKNPV